LHHLVEQVGVVKLADKFGKVEVFEYLACVFREALEVAFEVGLNAGFTQFGEIHLGGVKKAKALAVGLCGTKEQLFLGFFGQVHGFYFFVFGEYGVFSRLKYAFEAAQQGKWQNDAAILALLKITTQ
jgi:hypothetical protein